MERDLECRCCQGYWQSMTKKVGEGFVMAETKLKCWMGDRMGGGYMCKGVGWDKISRDVALREQNWHGGCQGKILAVG